MLPLLWLAAAASAEESHSLALSGGVSNFNKDRNWLEVGVEYRVPIDLWKLAVVAGISGNSGPSGWIYGGLRRDFGLRGPWVVTPAFAVSAYARGNGKDLGGPLEFRSSLEIGYRWPTERRLALAIHHLSNAGIYFRNPGMNSIVLTYSFPLR